MELPVSWVEKTPWLQMTFRQCFLKLLLLMEQISVFLLRESVLEQMLLVSLKKVLILRMH